MWKKRKDREDRRDKTIVDRYIYNNNNCKERKGKKG